MREATEQLRMMAQAGYFKCATYADLLESLAARLADLKAFMDEMRVDGGTITEWYEAEVVARASRAGKGE